MIATRINPRMTRPMVEIGAMLDSPKIFMMYSLFCVMWCNPLGDEVTRQRVRLGFYVTPTDIVYHVIMHDGDCYTYRILDR